MKKLLRPRTQGIAIIVVLLALMVVATVAGGLVLVSSGHLMHARSANESAEALYAAKAGAWIKLGQVRSGDLDPLSPTQMPAGKATYSATVTVGDGSKPFPPAGTYYVEAMGTSFDGRVRRVGILAELSESRWSHAAYGNTEVVMKSGSYTDSFNSDGLAFDHSEASVGTNNPVGGVKIEDNEAVVIGWSGSLEISTGKPKKKREKGDNPSLKAEANIQGPPGSTENVTVEGKGANKSYNAFVTGAVPANNDPVSVPSSIAAPAPAELPASAILDPLISPYPSVTTTTGVSLVPGAYNKLTVNSGGAAVLDVTSAPPGSEVAYYFDGITLNGGTLSVLQPDPLNPVTVKVYMDTKDGSDPTTGIHMTGSSLLNDTGKPINLQFLIAGTGTNTLEGHDELKDGISPSAYYVAYAPEAEIRISRGQIYGSVVADRVEMDGESLTDPDKAPAVIHFDTSLLEDTSNPPVLSILSVRNY